MPISSEFKYLPPPAAASNLRYIISFLNFLKYNGNILFSRQYGIQMNESIHELSVLNKYFFKAEKTNISNRSHQSANLVLIKIIT